MIVTGLIKLKLGETFHGLKNITIATSNGLVYSWGQNLLPKRQNNRKRIQQLAAIAAASVTNASSNGGANGSAYNINSSTASIAALRNATANSGSGLSAEGHLADGQATNECKSIFSA